MRDEIKPLLVVLIVAGSYVLLRYHPEFRRSPWPYFVLAAALIPLLSWILVSFQEPEVASSSPRSEDLMNQFIFILPALILAGSTRNTLTFWAVGILAALTLPWSSGAGLTEIIAATEGKRSGFGRHIISMGIVHGAILLGALIFFSRLVLHPRFSWWRFLLWSLLVGYMVFALLASQSRAVYLGILVALLVGFVWLVVYYFHYPQAWKKSWKVYVLIVLLLVAFLKIFQGTELVEATWERTLKEIQVYHQVIAGDWEEVPRNSAGLRIHFWTDVLEWAAERPVFGWGYGAGQQMHQQADNWFGDRYFITVHNDFLEILITYGLVGVAFVLTFFAWMGRQIYQAWKAGVMATDFLAFFVLFFIFYLVNSVFLTTFLFRDTVYLFNIIMAGAAGFVFKLRWQQDGR